VTIDEAIADCRQAINDQAMALDELKRDRDAGRAGVIDSACYFASSCYVLQIKLFKILEAMNA
jgi:uncharacterized protein (DUF927 family)